MNRNRQTTLSPQARAVLLRLAGDGIYKMSDQMRVSLVRRGFIHYDRHDRQWAVTSSGLDALAGVSIRIVQVTA